MTSLLWTFEEEKSNTSNVLLCPAELPNFWYKILMTTKIIEQNDVVKEDVEKFYEFHLSLLSYSYFSFTWYLFEKVNWQNCFEFLVLVLDHLLL